MATSTLSVSEAKSGFSNLIRRIEEDGSRFVITKNNRPVAKIVPLAGSEVRSARGALAEYANPDSSSAEASAFENAMVMKHAANR